MAIKPMKRINKRCDQRSAADASPALAPAFVLSGDTYNMKHYKPLVPCAATHT
jgi:hypothetical protein